jgi:hypothetical protein
MKIIITLMVLLLMSVSSAETIQFGNYTATFDMKRPHIIDGNIIRTYYGTFIFGENKTYDKLQYVGDVQLENQSGYLFINDKNYLIGVLNTAVDIESTMNLTSTLDFLKTLKIAKKAQL